MKVLVILINGILFSKQFHLGNRTFKILSQELKGRFTQKNENLLKTYWPLAHSRCKLICFFIRFGEM